MVSLDVVNIFTKVPTNETLLSELDPSVGEYTVVPLNNLVNSIRPSIEFTMEKETEQLAFVDVLITYTEYKFKTS